MLSVLRKKAKHLGTMDLSSDLDNLGPNETASSQLCSQRLGCALFVRVSGTPLAGSHYTSLLQYYVMHFLCLTAIVLIIRPHTPQTTRHIFSRYSGTPGDMYVNVVMHVTVDSSSIIIIGFGQ